MLAQTVGTCFFLTTSTNNRSCSLKRPSSIESISNSFVRIFWPPHFCPLWLILGLIFVSKVPLMLSSVEVDLTDASQPKLWEQTPQWWRKIFAQNGPYSSTKTKICLWFLLLLLLSWFGSLSRTDGGGGNSSFHPLKTTALETFGHSVD